MNLSKTYLFIIKQRHHTYVRICFQETIFTRFYKALKVIKKHFYFKHKSLPILKKQPYESFYKAWYLRRKWLTEHCWTECDINKTVACIIIILVLTRFKSYSPTEASKTVKTCMVLFAITHCQSIVMQLSSDTLCCRIQVS